MSFLPDILPADPSAPEAQRHQTRTLQYNIFGRLFMAVETMRKNRRQPALPHCMQRDLGLTDVAESVTRNNRPTWRADLDQCLSRPGFL